MREVNTTLDDVTFSSIVRIREKLMEYERRGEKTLRLESGEPNSDIPVLIEEEIIQAIRNKKTRYTPSTGIPELKAALFQQHTLENKISLNSPDDIIITNGGMGAISSSLKAIINPYKRDEIIIPDPNWTPTREMICMHHGIPIPVALDVNNGFRLDPEKVKERITPRTKAIVINSPHNPTGAVYSRQDMRDLVRIVENSGIFLLSDEAYEDLIFEGEHVSPGSLSVYEGIATLKTLSKRYSMTGLRVGSVATKHKKLMQNLKKVVLYTVNGVSSITQYGSHKGALSGEVNRWIQETVASYKERRDILMEGIKASRHFECETPQGAFYVFPKIVNYNGSDEDVKDILLDQNPHFGSVHGSSFGKAGEGHIRFAYSVSLEDVKTASEVIANLRI